MSDTKSISDLVSILGVDDEREAIGVIWNMYVYGQTEDAAAQFNSLSGTEQARFIEMLQQFNHEVPILNFVKTVLREAK